MILVELLAAMLISSFLVLGLVEIAAGARSSFRLQEAVAEVQENSRFAVATLAGAIRGAGYHPRPWLDDHEASGLTGENRDGGGSGSDRLAVSAWSDRNCFDNLNPALDASSRPAYYLRESVFELNGRRDLVHTCRYGPDSARLTTQIRRQGLIRNVESFQAQFSEDSDTDGSADRWTAGGEWLDEKRVLGVRIGLLLASSEPVVEPATQSHSVLDFHFTEPEDGRLRRVYTFATAIRGRNR